MAPQVLEELLPVRVGRHRYAVHVVRGPIVGGERRRKLFRIDHVNRCILLDGEIPLARRGDIQAAAVAAAWQDLVVPYDDVPSEQWL